MIPRLGHGMLAVVLLVGVGCSEGGFGDGSDASTGGDGGPIAPDTADTGVERDTATADGDSTDADDGEPRVGPVQSFTSCSAGGVSSGNGVTAIQCFGPAEISGREASGGNVRWQPGAFRVVSEGAK